MNDTDIKKRALLNQLLELYKKHDEEIAQYKKFIQNQIQNAEEGSVFYQGNDTFSDEIKNTELELVKLLAA